MKKQYFILLITLTVLVSSCIPIQKISYTVPAGNHRSVNKVTILKKDKMHFRFTTDSTWLWSPPEKNGWSKVVGIGWNNNHENSVRLVYMLINDSTGVFGDYYYVNGVSPQQNHEQKSILDTIQIGKTYNGQLGYSNGYYFVEINKKYHSLKVGNPLPDIVIRTLQHPYIGGTYVIEHDWTTTQKIR